ncbi:TRAP transporter substrate-binding protein DctP [Nitratireductor soli]|uniref:TRAP transporter substrate-binding protein DctP n=1 Tax=Nitratireductor soli TaxID=1670619 RepID=UPI00065E252C|nr:TRAP transporter substrate-binding protein DctP [Nitratireductor soli]
MRGKLLWALALGFAIAAAAPALSPARADEVVLNAVHFTPAQNAYAQSFLKFVEKVNERGKGIVQIKVRGGPEVVPPLQQGEAQKNGLIDMINTPAGLYLELAPEGEVFSATGKSVSDVRENGGWELISKIYAEKANAHLLAHVDAGAGFHVFTVKEPAKTDNGGIDWSALTIRSAPLYRDFLEALGATVIVQSPGEIYTSLERGVVNANAYTVFGYKSFGWDKFTKYRIDPSFFVTDVLVSMNQKKWESLSPEAQKILTDVALEHELESATANAEATVTQGQQMIDEGQTVVTLGETAAADFLAKAAEASWKRMNERDPTHIEALRALFQ